MSEYEDVRCGERKGPGYAHWCCGFCKQCGHRYEDCSIYKAQKRNDAIDRIDALIKSGTVEDWDEIGRLVEEMKRYR